MITDHQYLPVSCSSFRQVPSACSSPKSSSCSNNSEQSGSCFAEFLQAASTFCLCVIFSVFKFSSYFFHSFFVQACYQGLPVQKFSVLDFSLECRRSTPRRRTPWCTSWGSRCRSPNLQRRCPPTWFDRPPMV